MNVRGVAPHLAVASLATAGIVGLAEIQVRTFAAAAVALVAAPAATTLPLPGSRSAGRVVVIGGAAAGGSALAGTGPLAGTLAAGWFAATIVVALVAAAPLARPQRADRRRATVLTIVPFAWLALAAAWFVAHQSGSTVGGFGEPVVGLTSAHFHVAGFAANALVGTVWGGGRGDRALGRACAGSLASLNVGLVLVAAGWQLDAPRLHVVGAAALTVALALLAWAAFRATAAHPRCAARLVVRCASLAPAAPMLLAIIYAVGRVTSVSAPSIATMERAHGLTNALLFACVGLAGWRRLTGSGAEAVTATPVFVDAAPSLVPQEDTDAIARFT